MRGALGATRQIYFCGMGGFDNHSDLLQDQANLLTQLDAALSAFFSATIEIGIPDDITTFTESEFGRTGNSNANNGSDHAWGSHHMILGGTVKGGAAYGTFPTLALDGPALGAVASEDAISKIVLAGGFKHFRRATETPFNRVFEARN